MTKDEAIERMKAATPEAQPYSNNQHYLNFVNCLVALGMLELDEPKTREQLIAKACSIGGIKARDWNKVEHGLSLAGLKIVEK